MNHFHAALLLSLVCACQKHPSELPGPSPAPQQSENPMQVESNPLKPSIDRLHSAQTQLESGQPFFASGGEALDEAHFNQEDLALELSLFLLADASLHPKWVAAIQARAWTSDYEVRFGATGSVLFVGRTPKAGPDAVVRRFALNDLVSAFSGEE